MKQTQKPSAWLRCHLVALGSAASILCLAASGQTIPNPSFETDTFTTFPGYISGNSPITGWTADQPDHIGLNPAGGSPFADNGTIPDGKNVALIQSGAGGIIGASLSTTISGLTIGTTYKVTFRANARNAQAPALRVSLDGMELMAMTMHSAGGSNPYWYIAFEFTASAASQVLTLMNDTATDNTLLVDDFRIAPSSGRWTVEAWTDDSTSGIDANYFYTHAYKFGNAGNFTVNGVPFTGLAGNSPSAAGRFSTTYLTSGPVGRANNIFGDSTTLANNFVYGYAIPVGSYQSITINGLTPGTEYVATIFSYAWDDPSLAVRWATFSVGEDRLTVNQDQFYNNNGIRISYRYTADASGSVTLRVAPVNIVDNVSFHFCGFCNREAVSHNVAPIISTQPQGSVVAPGLPVTFTIVAAGIPAPTYQWRFNGANIAGAQDTTYTVSAASDLTAGVYDVVLANSMGSLTSAPARLTVGMALINPSFEADSYLSWPGYTGNNPGGAGTPAGPNWPITGWALDNTNGAGLNPIATGDAPFADNGVVPNGTNVVFIQSTNTLRQTISGFTVGSPYSVHYYENARSVVTLPALEVRIGGATVVPSHAIYPVGANPYHAIYSEPFIASATELELAFVKNPTDGDSTALLDNVTIVPIAAGTAPSVVTSPRSGLVSVADSFSFLAWGVGSPPLSYQWLKNGADVAGATNKTLNLSNIQKPAEADYSLRISNSAGSVTSAVAHLTVYEPIPDLFNTGVDSNRVAIADGAFDPHYQIIVNPDGDPTNAIIEDSTVFPISTGTWMRDTATSKWIGPRLNTTPSLGGTYTYRTVINLTDRDPSSVIIEGLWASDNAGKDILVNGLSTGNPQSLSFAGYTSFAVYGTNGFVAGTNTLDFVVQNDAVGYTGLRIEIVRSNVRIPPGTAPEFLAQPVGQKVAVGDTVTFTASARGTAPLSYQWKKDGVALAGQTTVTLVLTNVTAADSASYVLTVSNPAGSVDSKPAVLTVCRAIPGIFGTGVANDGTLLLGGATDPHYILGASADPSYPGPDAQVVNDAYPIQAGSWMLNGPNSKWIAPWANQDNSAGGSGGNAEGDYTYQTSFDLTGYDLTKVSIVGGWATDNGGTDLKVNGVSSGFTCSAFGSLTPFIITNGLVAGTNILDFVVNNATPTPNPTGLRVDLKGLLEIGQPAVRPTLQINLIGGKTVVSWTPYSTTQFLQWAPDAKGPWTNVTPPPAGSYTNTPGDAKMFFRTITIPTP